ncbi:hypothetical protein DPMN_074249 [Dreissena polymorpha]|uniref:Uncharacterized protein n=1 Tax=Dreissena polymorpha TaxID=45954 RepID=A0A9D3YI95_DREPO|nr:hypothetical protein DPMN_074249 [Dreissena polymorpha]
MFKFETNLDRQTDTQSYTHKYTQTYIRTDGQTDRQKDNAQTTTSTDKHTQTDGLQACMLKELKSCLVAGLNAQGTQVMSCCRLACSRNSDRSLTAITSTR